MGALGRRLPARSPDRLARGERAGHLIRARVAAGRALRPLGAGGRYRLARLAGLLAALASGGRLLGLVATAARARTLPAQARSAALATPARGAGRVGNGRGAGLAHPLLPQTLVLLVVLDAGTVVLGHANTSDDRAFLA